MDLEHNREELLTALRQERMVVYRDLCYPENGDDHDENMEECNCSVNYGTEGIENVRDTRMKPTEYVDLDITEKEMEACNQLMNSDRWKFIAKFFECYNNAIENNNNAIENNSKSQITFDKIGKRHKTARFIQKAFEYFTNTKCAISQFPAKIRQKYINGKTYDLGKDLNASKLWSTPQQHVYDVCNKLWVNGEIKRMWRNNGVLYLKLKDDDDDRFVFTHLEDL